MQDNKKEEPSADEVQSTRQYKKKFRRGPDVSSLVFMYCAGSGLCEGPITSSEESDCVCVCIIVCDLNSKAT